MKFAIQQISKDYDIRPDLHNWIKYPPMPICNLMHIGAQLSSSYEVQQVNNRSLSVC